MNEIKFFVLIIETNSQIKVPVNIKKIEKLENAFNAKKFTELRSSIVVLSLISV